jgi:arylsulfatase A-like enzyme
MVLLAALAGTLVGSHSLASDEDGPNVILIIIDTLRADHLGCYGYNRNTSPSIDGLADEAILFKNAISPSPWTSPAIGSFFTARYPYVLGYEHEAVVLDEKFLCLAEMFSAEGYKTGGIISHIYVGAELGFSQGFESFDEENAQGHGHISSPSVTDKGIAFIDSNRDEKFFLFLHYFDPHCDYILHEEYDYYPGYAGELYSGQPIEELREKAAHMTDDDVRYLNALYDSEIRFTDEHLGRFLKHVKDSGLYDDALIILVADHGEGFLERGDTWIGHTRTVYQEMVHVPFLVKLPGMSKGRVVDDWVSLVDFMPTVAAAAGLEIPEGYKHDGAAIDLAPGARPGRDRVFCQTKRWGDQQAAIKGDWKLIYDTQARYTRLFDLRNDPGETEDLSKAHPDTLLSLRNAWAKWDYDIKMARSRFKARPPKLSPEDEKKLKSLGYVH